VSSHVSTHIIIYFAKPYVHSIDVGQFKPRSTVEGANNESSEVCGSIKPGRRVKLKRSQAVNVHKLLTIRYLLEAAALSDFFSCFCK